jgi:hypothetical protein
MYLSQMLRDNSTLNFLDLSRNLFTDVGFEIFANEMINSKGITYLDLSKNKELSDEGSLIALANSISKNRMLRTLDLTGIRLRKPFLKVHLEPALQTNITLVEVMGKIPPGTIENELAVN